VDYGGLVYERVGSIKVLVGSETFAGRRLEWHPRDSLVQLRYFNRRPPGTNHRSRVSMSFPIGRMV
jgi:hypothetical protein